MIQARARCTLTSACLLAAAWVLCALPSPSQAQQADPLQPGKVWMVGHAFRLARAPHTSTPAPQGAEVIRYRILIQQGLEREAEPFTTMTHAVLGKAEGWSLAGLHMVHVERDHDITLVLAHGAVVDKLCLPLKTGRILSCALYKRANLNVSRWRLGAQSWKGDLEGYRHYLIGHEVGHLLGMPHVKCPGPGQPAPLMMQQTKRIAPCTRNHAPTTAELDLLRARRQAKRNAKRQAKRKP